MENFLPSWRDLLHPVLLPIVPNTPIPHRRIQFDQIPEPPSYVHLGARFVEPAGGFSEKLRVILNKIVLYRNFQKHNNENYSESQLKLLWEANIDIDLMPDTNTPETDESLKQNPRECFEKVMRNIPTRELAEHGIIIQTYRIDFEELDKYIYNKRVKEVIVEFLNRTVLYNNHIRNDNIMQVFLYEGYLYQPGRLFTKFSADRCRKIVEEIVNYFISKFNSLNELQQLVEICYLEHYKLTPTIYMILKSSLSESLCQRSFYKEIYLFMESPAYSSATHGLQRLCRKKILMCLLKCHANFLVLQAEQTISLTAERKKKLVVIFIQALISVLALGKYEEW